jgi:hypothetical protein
MAVLALVAVLVGTARAEGPLVIPVGANQPVYVAGADGSIAAVLTVDANGDIRQVFADAFSPTGWSEVVVTPSYASFVVPVIPPNIPVVPSTVPPFGGVVGGTVFGPVRPIQLRFTMSDGTVAFVERGI